MTATLRRYAPALLIAAAVILGVISIVIAVRYTGTAPAVRYAPVQHLGDGTSPYIFYRT